MPPALLYDSRFHQRSAKAPLTAVLKTAFLTSAAVQGRALQIEPGRRVSADVPECAPQFAKLAVKPLWLGLRGPKNQSHGPEPWLSRVLASPLGFLSVLVNSALAGVMSFYHLAYPPVSGNA